MSSATIFIVLQSIIIGFFFSPSVKQLIIYVGPRVIRCLIRIAIGRMRFTYRRTLNLKLGYVEFMRNLAAHIAYLNQKCCLKSNHGCRDLFQLTSHRMPGYVLLGDILRPLASCVMCRASSTIYLNFFFSETEMARPLVFGM